MLVRPRSDLIRRYLHGAKVAYRDLKPENILLGLDGYVVLADFGLATRLDDDAPCTSICGTPLYRFPGPQDTSRRLRMSCRVLAADAASGPTPRKSSKTDSVSHRTRSRRSYPARARINAYTGAAAAFDVDMSLMNRGGPPAAADVGSIRGDERLRYLAPELVGRRPYGASVDWWALGCVCHEMLQGAPPCGEPASKYRVPSDFCGVGDGPRRLA